MNKNCLTTKDYCVIVGIVTFFLGCIASSHRSAKTLEESQASLGVSYLRASTMENENTEPIQLVALDYRVGIARGVDFGLMHTWDVSKDNDNAFATMWGDCKVQLTNRENIIGEPIISLGLIKGYVHPNDTKLHITSVPVMLSLPLSNFVTPTVFYRHELISNDFIPKGTKNPRMIYGFGMEFNLTDPQSGKYVPKFALSFGNFNSLTGGEGDRGIIVNFGICVDFPPRGK